MDAIVLLKNDHKVVKGLFKKLKGHDLSVVPDICDELTVHAEIEERIFYPAIRGHVENLDVNEAYEEHHVAKVLIEELQALTPDDDSYEAKAVVLMEMVEHHVEEEEGELFPDVRDALGRNRLKEIGAELEALKADLKASVGTAQRARSKSRSKVA